jgi:hypothetical protein
MGVEGKDRAKVLQAGAASKSNQVGLAVLRLREGYGLSLAGGSIWPATDRSWAMVS